MAKDQDIRRELEELKEQLEAMQAEEEKVAAKAGAGESEAAEQVADEQEEGVDIAAHVKGLLEALEEELEESNPKTLLAVFALGVLIGRLLAR